MTNTELDLLHKLSILYYQKMESFLNLYAPGIKFLDPFTDIIWLLSSKNPDLHIKAFFDSSNSYSKYPINLENFTELIAPLMSLNQKAKSNNTIFEYLLDPIIKDAHNAAAKIPIDKFKSIYARLNKTVAFPGVFSILWYSTLPCFDVEGVTSSKDGDKSLLRYCTWKEIEVPCSAIFSTFPTDQGMCCAFNMKSAEEIFQGKSYSNMIQSLQNDDKNNAFKNSTLPDWYVVSNEPKTQSGLKKGLSVMLDAHSDIFATGSSDTDFQGFTVLIDSSGSYPLISQNGFQIRSGHNNMVALSATKVSISSTFYAQVFCTKFLAPKFQTQNTGL